MYSYGSPHMAAQKQDDQHERTFSSYVRIQVVVLKTYLGRWTIGRSGERGSGISVLPARYDDDDELPTNFSKYCKIWLSFFSLKWNGNILPQWKCSAMFFCLTESWMFLKDSRKIIPIWFLCLMTNFVGYLMPKPPFKNGGGTIIGRIRGFLPLSRAFVWKLT